MRQAAHAAVVSLFVIATVAFAVEQAAAQAQLRNDPGAAVPGANGPSRSVTDGVYTLQGSRAGESLFNRICTNCHSADEFAGPAFVRRWGQRTVGDLFSLLQGTMPATSPGSLSAGQYAELTSYLLRLNGFPSGDTELPADAQSLRAVRF